MFNPLYYRFLPPPPPLPPTAGADALAGARGVQRVRAPTLRLATLGPPPRGLRRAHHRPRLCSRHRRGACCSRTCRGPFLSRCRGRAHGRPCCSRNCRGAGGHSFRRRHGRLHHCRCRHCPCHRYHCSRLYRSRLRVRLCRLHHGSRSFRRRDFRPRRLRCEQWELRCEQRRRRRHCSRPPFCCRHGSHCRPRHFYLRHASRLHSSCARFHVSGRRLSPREKTAGGSQEHYNIGWVYPREDH